MHLTKQQLIVNLQSQIKIEDAKFAAYLSQENFVTGLHAEAVKSSIKEMKRQLDELLTQGEPDISEPKTDTPISEAKPSPKESESPNRFLYENLLVGLLTEVLDTFAAVENKQEDLLSRIKEAVSQG